MLILQGVKAVKLVQILRYSLSESERAKFFRLHTLYAHIHYTIGTKHKITHYDRAEMDCARNIEFLFLFFHVLKEPIRIFLREESCKLQIHFILF